VKPDAQAPVGVDYDRWLGPAPKKPFNPNRFHGNFRYFWDYAGGLMTDWGVHMIDMVLAGMKVDVPISASAVGGKYGYPDNAGETPDSLYTVYDFGNFSMQWEQTFGVGRGPYNQDIGEPGVAFIGNNGTLVINRTKWQVYPEMKDGKPMMQSPEIVYSKTNGLDHHTLNFLNCIRSRQQPNCTIEMGRNAAITAQLGNIAYRTESKVLWDDKNSRIIDNKEAEKMAKAYYRSPWKLPTI
jgi:predicted dehydrogenase